MLHWFQASAPIRTKFDALFVVYVGLSAISAGTTWLALTGAAPMMTLMGIAVGTVVLTGVVALTAKKLVCDPYVGTVVRMEGLAAGDLASPIAHNEFTDCVGRMTRAMSVFRQNAETVQTASASQQHVVESLGAGLSRLADSDLSYRIDEAFPADYEKLRVDYNRAMDAFAEVMGAVVEATSGINNGASDIRQASDDLSQRTEQQAASLEETAAAMDEITSTVRETAAGATRANSVVGETRVEAEQSGDVVRRAVDAMSGIERASAEISDIISVIDGIAFQTNLLALNAGVEAARAGDAGKGFAVVASEVRALAQRSADAAKDVKAKIMASSEQVDVGVELVSETGKALQRIIGRIGEISGLVATIATAAEQQATGPPAVNTAVSEMDGVTQQNAAMVEQATAAARSLSEEADELARQVARFRIDDYRGGRRAEDAGPPASGACRQGRSPDRAGSGRASRRDRPATPRSSIVTTTGRSSDPRSVAEEADAMTTLLPASLDTAAAGPLRLELRTLVDAHEPVMLDGSAVERIGQACLQVLAAAQVAAAAAGLAFAIDMPSPALIEMAGLAGLATLLPTQG